MAIIFVLKLVLAVIIIFVIILVAGVVVVITINIPSSYISSLPPPLSCRLPLIIIIVITIDIVACTL